MEKSPTSPLRERKRAALQAAIERATVELAAELGYDHVTVEMICERAMTSPRTFFNYFGSKESAILGSSLRMAPQEGIDRFVENVTGDVLTDFLVMVVDSLTDVADDRQLYQMRQEVIYQTPELAAKRFALSGQIEERYVDVLLQRFRAEGRDVDGDPEVEDEARMIIALTRGVMTYTAAKWFTPGYDRSVFELLSNAVVLMRKIASRQPGAKQ